MNKKQFIDSVNTIDNLSAAENLIVNYFIDHYTMLPFAKIDVLCKQIGIGKATLGRFLNRLGFTGFMQFKKRVSEDLVQELSTPIDRCISGQGEKNNDCVISAHYQEVMGNMESTFESLSHDDFYQALHYVTNQEGKLYIIGSASAEALANYYYLLARYLRKDVVLIRADPSTLPHQLVDVTQKDTLFAISYHRFSSITIRLVHWFKEYGGKIIVLTDQQVNPFVSYADIIFSVESESEGIFNNRTAGFSLIEAFIKGMSNTKDKEERFSKIEDTFSDFDFFKNN